MLKKFKAMSKTKKIFTIALIIFLLALISSIGDGDELQEETQTQVVDEELGDDGVEEESEDSAIEDVEIAKVEEIDEEEILAEDNELTEQEEAYVNVIAVHSDLVATTMNGISESISNNDFESTIIYAESLVVLSEQYLDSINEAPEIFEDVHSYYSSAMLEFSTAGDLLIEGIEKTSAEHIELAGLYIEDGTEYIDLAMVKLLEMAD